MPEYVYALHDFLPENEDEVSFNAGERIEVIEKDDMFGDGWWQVCVLAFQFIQKVDDFNRAVILLAKLVYFPSATQHQRPLLKPLLTYPLPNPSLMVHQPTISNPSYSLFLKNPKTMPQPLISCLPSQNILQVPSLTVTSTLNTPMRVRLLPIMLVVTTR